MTSDKFNIYFLIISIRKRITVWILEKYYEIPFSEIPRIIKDILFFYRIIQEFNFALYLNFQLKSVVMTHSDAPHKRYTPGPEILNGFIEMLGIKQVEALAFELGDDWNQKKSFTVGAERNCKMNILAQVAKNTESSSGGD